MPDNVTPSRVPGTRPAFARWLGTTNEITKGFLAAGRVPGLINMAGGLPAPETYRVTELAALAQQAVVDFPNETLGYGPIDGLPDLRDALAARFATPAMRLSRENVLVTSSGMQALDLIGKVLLEPGGVIAGQFPTYLGALDAWRPRCPTYRPFSLDDGAFDAVATFAGAQFAYTVPNFSNPTGKLVGLQWRHTLVDAARKTGTWLVEDDPYGTLHYDEEPLPRMIEISQAEHGNGSYEGAVVYVGTLSKEVAPGLRIGWVVAAPRMIEALTVAKQGSDMCTSGLTQRVALAAMQTGLLARIQPMIQELYRRRRDALCAAMITHLADWFEWEVPVGGMFVWAVSRDPAMNTDRLLQEALKAGVCVTPSSVFDPSGQYRRAIRLNFTLNPPETLVEGTRRLALAAKALAMQKD